MPGCFLYLSLFHHYKWLEWTNLLNIVHKSANQKMVARAKKKIRLTSFQDHHLRITLSSSQKEIREKWNKQTKNLLVPIAALSGVQGMHEREGNMTGRRLKQRWPQVSWSLSRTTDRVTHTPGLRYGIRDLQHQVPDFRGPQASNLKDWAPIICILKIFAV